MTQPTPKQIIEGLRAELQKPELSDERRQELQHALDYQLEIEDHAGSGWKPPPYPATPTEHQRVAEHRFAQASGLGSAARGGDHSPLDSHGGSDNYRQEHSLAAIRPKLPPLPYGNDAQELEVLKAHRYLARQYAQAFQLRTDNNRTGAGHDADDACRAEWAGFVDELTRQIDRVRSRVNHAARRGR